MGRSGCHTCGGIPGERVVVPGVPVRQLLIALAPASIGGRRPCIKLLHTGSHEGLFTAVVQGFRQCSVDACQTRDIDNQREGSQAR